MLSSFLLELNPFSSCLWLQWASGAPLRLPRAPCPAASPFLYP